MAAIGEKNKKKQVQSYGEGFRQNVEAVRSNYETYRKKDDPSVRETQKGLDRGSSKTESKVRQANKEADDELDRERRRHEMAAQGKTRPEQSKKWVE